jgi:Flp pilus assembly protein TadD
LPNINRIFLKGFRPYLWIIGLGFLLYFQALGLGYVSLDDEHLIIQNYPHISNLANLPQAFLKDVYWRNPGTYYRPLLNVSLMLDAVWGGIKPFAYHLTNVLLHLACGMLMFLLFNRLGFGGGRALFVSLFYLVHPALAQAVAWIPGRNDTLLTLFVISAFLLLIRYLKSNQPLDLAGHLLFFALACLTKEAAVVFPIIGLAYVGIVSRESSKLRKAVMLAAGWAAILAAWYWMRWQAITPAVNAHTRQFANFSETLKGLVSYTGKAFFPFDLSVLPLSGDVKIYWGAATAVLLTILAFIGGLHNRKVFIFGLFWYLVFLLPTFIKLAGQINYLEHRLYLPLLGLAIMLLSFKLVHNISPKTALTACLPVLFLFSALTVVRIPDFSNGITFWNNAAQTSPSSALAHQMLGRAMVKASRPAEAELEYSLASQLEPGSPSSYNDLGMLYMNYGKYEKAAVQFKQVLAIDPGYANVRNNLALAYYNLGKYDSSRIQLQAAVRLDSGASEPFGNLGVLYLQVGGYDSAEYYLNKVLSLDPGNRPARQHLAWLRQLKDKR